MSDTKNELHGALFVNDKGGVPGRADFQGNALIAGKQYWVKAWKNYTKDRMEWFSLVFEPKTIAPPRAPLPDLKRADFDDDVPF